MFCHVVGEVLLHVSGTGEAQTGADTFVAAVCSTAKDKRAHFPAFPHVAGSSVWHVLQLLEVNVLL